MATAVTAYPFTYCLVNDTDRQMARTLSEEIERGIFGLVVLSYYPPTGSNLTALSA
jgi:hypothetical protein